MPERYSQPNSGNITPSLKTELSTQLNPANILHTFVTAPPISPRQMIRETPQLALMLGTTYAMGKGFELVNDKLNIHDLRIWSFEMLAALVGARTAVIALTYVTEKHFSTSFFKKDLPSK